MPAAPSNSTSTHDERPETLAATTPALFAPRTPALLALADGTLFRGHAIGAHGHAVGEVVFNTAMTGYQEILTDPSYAGQIVTLTYPHIGNVGVNPEDVESRRVFAAGLVIRNLPLLASNWRKQNVLSSYLDAANVVGIADIDTRKLTRMLRERGAQNGCIVAAAAGFGSRCRGRDRAGACCAVDGGTRSRQGRVVHRALRVGVRHVGACHRLSSDRARRNSTSSRTTSASSTTSCGYWRTMAAASP